MLVPAYAATIHKSQGSEYPAVIIPVLTQHYAMLQRNLLYTGVTRGKKLVVLVGQKKAVAMCATCWAGGGGRSSASGCGQNRLSHDSSAWRVEPGSQRTFCRIPRSRSGSMASSQPGRYSPSTACRHCARSDATAITNDGRPPGDADLVVHALALL